MASVGRIVGRFAHSAFTIEQALTMSNVQVGYGHDRRNRHDLLEYLDGAVSMLQLIGDTRSCSRFPTQPRSVKIWG